MNITVKLPDEVMERCKEFAKIRAEGSAKVYQFRGEANRQKIYSDILLGTLSEFAVASVLPNCTEPDLTIYEKKDKSYAKDLMFGPYHVHVKSQGETSAKRYGLSWVFQKTDPLVRSPQKHDLLALCCVNNDLTVEIIGIVPASKAVFKDLKVYQYRGTKTALYRQDIENVMTLEEVYELGKEKTEEVPEV